MNSTIDTASSTQLRYYRGTLEIHGIPNPNILPEACVHDARTDCHRAPAVAYAEVVTALVRGGIFGFGMP